MTTPKTEDAVFLAKLAEQAERYEGMLPPQSQVLPNKIRDG
jgi:hypothetical protein